MSMNRYARVSVLACVAAVGILATVISAAQGAIATGPEVGEKIPHFQTRDQSGRMRRFEDLRGSEGLLLLFHRTADW